jgi:hypothetical protein
VQPGAILEKQPSANPIPPQAAERQRTSGFIVALLAFCFVNLSMFSLVNRQPKHFDLSSLNQQRRMFGRVGSWWLAKAYLQQEPPPTVFIFGSSQMGGLHCADARVLGRNIDFVLDHQSVTLEQELAKRLHGKVTVFNGAIPGAMISDQVVISKAFFTKQSKPKVVIIGFSPRDFIDNTCPSPTSTEAFMFFSKFADLGKELPLFFSNWIDQTQWQISQSLPLRNNMQALLSNGSTSAVHTMRKATTAQQAMMYKPFEPMEPGQCTIGPHPAKIFVDNSEDYSHRYRNCLNGTLKQQLEFFQIFCSQMKENNIQVVAVGMPLLSINRALLPTFFWSYFFSEIKGITNATGAHWINFSDSPAFQRDDYFDTVHLNTEGGLKFARMLSDSMMAEPSLAAYLQSEVIKSRASTIKGD